MQRSELEQTHGVIGDHIAGRCRQHLLTDGSHLANGLLGLCQLLGGEVVERDAVREGCGDCVLHFGLKAGRSADGGFGIAGNVVFATRCPQRTHAGTLTAVQLREVGPGSPDPHLATDSRCVRSADSATPCHPWHEVSRTSTPGVRFVVFERRSTLPPTTEVPCSRGVQGDSTAKQRAKDQ